MILVVRDSDDDAGAELLRKAVKNNKKTETRAKVSLKEIELAEGETCSAKIIVQARDRSGVLLSSDESEPFWIEGSNQQGAETGKKKVNRIRNRAEAFFVSAHRSRKKMEIDSEGWEEGRQLLYRVKLKNRDIYHIVLNPFLYAVELRNLSDPLTGGAWEANVRNRGSVEADALHSVPVTASGLSTPFARASTGLVHHALADWRGSAILIVQSGSPFTVNLSAAEDIANVGLVNGNNLERPNLAGNPNDGPKTPMQWFNTSAFALPPQFSFGDAGRNIVIGPGLASLDLSLQKVWSIHENQNLQFRWDIFNALNHPNLNLPGRIFGAANFGVITTAEDARELQFALKWLF